MRYTEVKSSNDTVIMITNLLTGETKDHSTEFVKTHKVLSDLVSDGYTIIDVFKNKHVTEYIMEGKESHSNLDPFYNGVSVLSDNVVSVVSDNKDISDEFRRKF